MIDFHCASPARLVVNVHVHVAAPQAVSNGLPDARFEHFKPVRHPKMKVQESMVHASQIDSNGASVLLDAGLRKAGHRINSSECRCGFHRSAFGAGVAASSTSANCISYRRA